MERNRRCTSRASPRDGTLARLSTYGFKYRRNCRRRTPRRVLIASRNHRWPDNPQTWRGATLIVLFQQVEVARHKALRGFDAGARTAGTGVHLSIEAALRQITRLHDPAPPPATPRPLWHPPSIRRRTRFTSYCRISAARLPLRLRRMDRRHPIPSPPSSTRATGWRAVTNDRFASTRHRAVQLKGKERYSRRTSRFPILRGSSSSAVHRPGNRPNTAAARRRDSIRSSSPRNWNGQEMIPALLAGLLSPQLSWALTRSLPNSPEPPRGAFSRRAAASTSWRAVSPSRSLQLVASRFCREPRRGG